jgi:hypothetical protein
LVVEKETEEERLKREEEAWQRQDANKKDMENKNVYCEIVEIISTEEKERKAEDVAQQRQQEADARRRQDEERERKAEEEALQGQEEASEATGRGGGGAGGRGWSRKKKDNGRGLIVRLTRLREEALLCDSRAERKRITEEALLCNSWSDGVEELELRLHTTRQSVFLKLLHSYRANFENPKINLGEFSELSPPSFIKILLHNFYIMKKVRTHPQ